MTQGTVMRLVLIIVATILISKSVLHSQEKTVSSKVSQKTIVPHKADETKLVQIKAEPEKFVRELVIICGVISEDDFDNHKDEDFKYDKKDYGLFRITEVGKRLEDIEDSAYIFVSRENDAFDTIVSACKQNSASAPDRLVRAIVLTDGRFW